MVVGDEVPVICRAPPREAGVARASVPAGVRARPHRARPVRRVRRGSCAAPAGAGARPRRARRGDAALRHVEQRRRQARALDRARRRGAATPGAGARLPRRRTRRFRALGQPTRSGEAGRHAARGGRARAVAAGRHRRRRPGPRGLRAARARRGVDGRVRFAGRVVGEELADLYATCFADLLRAGRRGFRAGPVRVVPLRQAGDHRDRCGRPARGRPRRLDGARRRAGGGRGRPRPRSGCASIPSEAAAYGRAGKAIAARSPGIARSGGCCREGRALQPDAAGALGDRRLLGAAAARAAGAVRGRRRQARREEAAARNAISASTTSATIRRLTAGSSRRCGARPGSSCCTTSCSTISSRG